MSGRLKIGFAISFFIIVLPLLNGAEQHQYIDPLIDTPGKTIGSDFNGDGTHDFIVGAHDNVDCTAGACGAAYIFFGSTTISGTKDLGGVQSADVTILGKGDDNDFGRSVSSVGDVNGDGIDDFIVGANQYDISGANLEGAAYIFFGASDLSGTKDLGGVASADVTFLGKVAGDGLGDSVSGAGDVNGDGFDDIIVGASGYDVTGANNEGAAYIFFGASDLNGTKSLGEGQSADITILGKASGDRLGAGGSASGAGDINGDGFDDIIVGALHNDDGGGGNEGGAAYVFFGASNLSGTKSLGAGASADITFLGKGGGYDYLGSRVAGAGDVNGDGFDDIIVAAYLNSEGSAGTYAGAAYIFFGASNLSGTKDLGGAASADVTVLGKANNDRLGMGGVSGAGDINDDGFDDVIIGANYNDDGGASNEGAAYIFFGSSTLSGTKSLGGGQSADVTILGKETSSNLGRGVSGTGDVNADGIPDVIVGAYNNDDCAAGSNCGAAYVFFGSTTLSGTKDTGASDEDVTILGKGAGDNLGNSVGGGRSNPGP